MNREELLEWAETIIPCNCGEAYISRNLIAPDCLFHNGAETILDELLLRGYRVEATGVKTEWAIQYVDHKQVTMTGSPTVTMIVQNEDIARTAARWTYGDWADRDVKVVHREVTEWEQG